MLHMEKAWPLDSRPSSCARPSRGNLRVVYGQRIVGGSFSGARGELRGARICACTLASAAASHLPASSQKRNPTATRSQWTQQFSCASGNFQNRVACRASRKSGRPGGEGTRRLDRLCGDLVSLIRVSSGRPAAHLLPPRHIPCGLTCSVVATAMSVTDILGCSSHRQK